MQSAGRRTRKRWSNDASSRQHSHLRARDHIGGFQLANPWARVGDFAFRLQGQSMQEQRIFMPKLLSYLYVQPQRESVIDTETASPQASNYRIGLDARLRNQDCKILSQFSCRDMHIARDLHRCNRSSRTGVSRESGEWSRSTLGRFSVHHSSQRV